MPKRKSRQEARMDQLRSRTLHPSALESYAAAIELFSHRPQIIRRLPPNVREVMKLYLLDLRQLSLDDCGQELGITGELVRARLAKGARLLKRLAR